MSLIIRLKEVQDQDVECSAPARLPAGGSARIITFANTKGGAGKSTACAAIAGALTHRGACVHIIDMEPDNPHLLRWSETFHPQRVIVEQVQEDAFPDHFERVRGSGVADYILIDLPGAYAKALTFAAGSADIVVIPVMPSEPNLHGAVQTIREIRHLERAYQAQIPGFSIPHFVLKTNISPLNNNKAARWLDAEIERIRMPHLKACLLARPVYQDVFSTGLPAHQVDPASPAALDVDAVVAEITSNSKRPSVETEVRSA